MSNKRRNQRSTSDNSTIKGKSGMKLHTPFKQDEGVFMHGWKIIDGVMASIKIFQSDKQKKEPLTKSSTNKLWAQVTMVAERPMMETVVRSGLMNIADHRVYFKEWNWIANPHASNGGYIGKHISKD